MTRRGALRPRWAAWATPTIQALGGRLCDNAPAESIVGLYETEFIARCGPWRHWEAVEPATLRRVHRYNHRRLLEPLGHVPRTGFEAHYHQQPQESAVAARLGQATLRRHPGRFGCGPPWLEGPRLPA